MIMTVRISAHGFNTYLSVFEKIDGYNTTSLLSTCLAGRRTKLSIVHEFTSQEVKRVSVLRAKVGCT